MARYGQSEPVGDVVGGAQLNLVEQSVLDGRAECSPGSNSQDEGSVFGIARKGHPERRRLIHLRMNGHATRVARFAAVDVDGKLPEGIAGNEKFEGRGAIVAIGELLRLQSQAVPCIPGVGIDALFGKHLAESYRGPG